MLRITLTILLLISGSTASAIEPDISFTTQVVAIAPITTQTPEPTRTSCVGTLIGRARLVTASHCLPTSLTSIAVRCLSDVEAPTMIAPVKLLRHHVDQDVAVVHFQAQTECHTPLNTLGLTSAVDQPLFIYSQHTLALYSLEVLQEQQYNYIVSDASCQTQGDSGSPVFTRTQDGEIVLAAMLISGTADCPSLQILAKLYNLQDWLLDMPAE